MELIDSIHLIYQNDFERKKFSPFLSSIFVRIDTLDVEGIVA